MIHAREDYARFQDPATQEPKLLGAGCSPVGEDEPVFLLRGKDKFFVPMLKAYMKLIAADHNVGYDMELAIDKHIEYSEWWQSREGTKTPDMPES
jgi:hypothetical protein